LSHDFSEPLEISQGQDAVSSENLSETVRKESAKHVSVQRKVLSVVHASIVI